MTTIESPRELFVHKLGAALKMEKTIHNTLPQLEKEANDGELKRNLAQHRRETEQQLRNLERVFEALGEDPTEQPCPTIEALEKEREQNLKQVADDLNDAVVLSGLIETEAHEIAVYDGLITQAEAMDEQDIVALLQENLEQEQATLQKARKATKKLAQAQAHAAAR
jgi:ferritin-like metal-binding protein YciE